MFQPIFFQSQLCLMRLCWRFTFTILTQFITRMISLFQWYNLLLLHLLLDYYSFIFINCFSFYFYTSKVTCVQQEDVMQQHSLHILYLHRQLHFYGYSSLFPSALPDTSPPAVLTRLSDSTLHSYLVYVLLVLYV